MSRSGFPTKNLLIHLIDLSNLRRLKVTNSMTYADALLYYIANSNKIEDKDMALLIDKTPDIKTINEILERMSADPETVRRINVNILHHLLFLAVIEEQYIKKTAAPLYRKPQFL